MTATLPAPSPSRGLLTYAEPETRPSLTFFASLLSDYPRDQTADDTTDTPQPPVDAPDSLPIPWLARFVHEVCSPLSFDLGVEDEAEAVHTALARHIA